MNPVNLFVSPKLAAAAQSSNSNMLAVPDDAAHSRGGGRRWSERLTILSAKAIPNLDNDGKETGRTLMEIRFKVSAQSPTPVNIGRNTSGRYLVNFSAPEGHGDNIMTNISLGRVFSLLRAVGFEVSVNEGVDLQPFFGEESPLKGMDVNGVVSTRQDKMDPSITRQDIGQFTAVED